MSEERTTLKNMILEIDGRKSEIRCHKHELKVMTEDLKELEDNFHKLALVEFTKEPTLGEEYDSLMKVSRGSVNLPSEADF